MQISPLVSGRTTPTLPAPGGVSGTGASRATAPILATGIPAAPASPAETPPQRGLSTLVPNLNQDVNRAQQTLSYLDQLDEQLAALKSEASAQLSVPASPRTLDARLQRVQALWQQRPQATGGALSPQLRFSASGQTEQTFRLRGLDARAMALPDRETLSFLTASGSLADRRVLTAVLTPAQTPEERLNRLDEALAPAGIRVHRQADGDLTLQTSEARWPSLRDGLSVRGGGIRFPGNQFHRVKLEAEPDALQPGTWRVNDAQALRQTLQQVVPAQSQVRAARAQVAQTLDTLTDSQRATGSMADPQWAQDFARSFAELGQESSYSVFAALAPAVQGISRPRTEALLTPAR